MSDDTVKLGEDLTTLADIGAMDLDAFAEKRMFRFPKGHFRWRVVADENTGAPAVQKIGESGKGGVVFNLECIDVKAVNDPSLAPDGDVMKLIGMKHRETMFLTTVDSIGYLKAFLVDMGSKGSGKMADILASTVGIEFEAPIVHRANKDDKDAEPYVNIDRNKIVPKAKFKQAA